MHRGRGNYIGKLVRMGENVEILVDGEIVEKIIVEGKNGRR